MASTQPDPTYAALVQAYYSESFSNVAVTCLVVYEFIDTFISEIHLVWKRPVTISAALLGSVRWCMIAGVILSAAASPVTVKGCAEAMILLRVFNMLGYAQTAIFSGLRVFAISDRNYYWASLVFALGMTPFGTNLALTAMSSFGYIPEPLVGGCYSVVGQSERTGNILTYFTRGSLIASDAIVLVLTWINTFGQWRRARQAKVRVSLTGCLLRDGTFYFIALVAINLAHMLTFNLSVLDESPTGPLITNLPLVLINRFMINLRTTDSEMADVSLASIADQQQPQPTLQFRRPTDRLGNIGESLHHSWDDHWDGEDETGVEAYRFDDAVSSHDSKIECEVGCEVHSHASEMFVEGSSARV